MGGDQRRGCRRDAVTLERCEHPVVDDEEFDLWYELNTREGDRHSPRDEMALREWFRDLFDLCGPVPRSEFVAALRFRQAATVKRAIGKVIEDLHTTMGCRPIVSVENDPELIISFWGVGGMLKSRCGLSRDAVDELDLFLIAAGDLQDRIREDLNEVWPRCPRHILGLRPGVGDQTGIWWCRYGDGHLVANIGSLDRAFSSD